MHISSLTLTNFRCFGSAATQVTLQPDLTCLIGNNASGKTAVFQALNRLFGVGSNNRRVIKEDFHLSLNTAALTSGTELVIDAVLKFPELAENAEAASNTVPAFFNHFIVEGTEELPKARIQLRATWEDDGSTEGVVTEHLRWIPCMGNEFDFEACQRVQPAERSAIQFIYIPAKRDAANQAAAVLKSRLWKAALWSGDFEADTQTAIDQLQAKFVTESPVQLVSEMLQTKWQQLNTSNLFIKPEIHLLESSFESLIQNAAFMLSPDESGVARPIASLSDGQSSLFYMALVAATLGVEKQVNATNNAAAFSSSLLAQTALTLLAIEEPENNLSPFYLSRIVKLAKGLAKDTAAQVVVSSHSPALVGRIEPDQIRYLRLNDTTRTSYCKSLTLPSKTEDVGKFVRLAVQAYPEVYFARFVILAEGDSEQLIIPPVAEALEIELDPSFVPVVPLNGRYVEHFWRLLEDLEIPYATLIDLDLGRKHGGLGLLQHYKELLKSYKQVEIKFDLEALEDKDLLAEEHLVFTAFQNEGLFFSNPVDIDFSMLAAFTEDYKASLEEGRAGPKPANFTTAIEAVVKKCGKPEIYEKSFYYTPEFFAWYRYLFLGNSKPDSHFLVLSKIEKNELAQKAPKELIALVRHVASELGLN